MKTAQSLYRIPSLFEPWGTCLSHVITNAYLQVIIALNKTNHTMGFHFRQCVKQTDKTYVAGASARHEEF